MLNKKNFIFTINTFIIIISFTSVSIELVMLYPVKIIINNVRMKQVKMRMNERIMIVK